MRQVLTMSDQPISTGESSPPPADEKREGATLEQRSGERIAKLLARAGVASRREVERMIAEGRVKLNGVLVTAPSTVLPNLHGITVDDIPIAEPEAPRLFAFHKPTGLLTAERDPAGRPTIYAALRNALPPGTPRLMPVGRLDLNTEGLLLLTNDGELKRAMELPSSGIPRTYRARTYGEVSQPQLEALMAGTTIEGVHYGRIDANMERRTGRNQWIELKLTEGKNREVRRVLEALGLEVSRLLRTSYGPFELLDLPRGAAIEIAPVEVEKFRKTLKLAPATQTARRPVEAAAAGTPAPAPRRDPRTGSPRRKPDPSRPVDRDAPRSPPRGREGGRDGARETGRGGRPDGFRPDARTNSRDAPRSVSRRGGKPDAARPTDRDGPRTPPRGGSDGPRGKPSGKPASAGSRSDRPRDDGPRNDGPKDNNRRGPRR